jgi:haloacid dehalogenase-like hydrolase
MNVGRDPLILSRRSVLLGASASTLATFLSPGPVAAQADDPLPSWNDGAAKRAIIELVTTTTTRGSSNFVPEGERIATFDQDGTTWVEHDPVYNEVIFSLDRIVELAPSHPEWKTTQPFQAVIDRDEPAIASFAKPEWEKVMLATHTGVTVGDFSTAVQAWMAKAKDRRWQRSYTDLIYLPMLEAMRYLRANGYRTYIVTGGTQPFVRAYANSAYGIAPEYIIGTAMGTQFVATNGAMTLAPTLLLNANFSGKAEDIYLFTGLAPKIAFGNTEGDAAMLEYAQAGGRGAAMLLVLHDDPVREFAYGPAEGLPNSKIGSFSQALYDKAKTSGWRVISMKDDWKRIFSWQT